jgi:hypothetical protein
LHDAETGSIPSVQLTQSQYLALFAPAWWQIGKAGYADATGKRSVDGSLDNVCARLLKKLERVLPEAWHEVSAHGRG